MVFNFSHLKLCLAIAIHNFKWLKIDSRRSIVAAPCLQSVLLSLTVLIVHLYSRHPNLTCVMLTYNFQTRCYLQCLITCFAVQVIYSLCEQSTYTNNIGLSQPRVRTYLIKTLLLIIIIQSRFDPFEIVFRYRDLHIKSWLSKWSQQVIAC